MKIAMVAPRPGREGEGIARHAERLAGAIAEAGHDVEVLTPERWTALRGRASGFDVVHLHGARTVLGLRGALPPVVVSPHLHRAPFTRVGRVVQPVYGRLGAPALARADLVLCASRAEAERVVRLVPAAALRTHVVPEGIDAAAIRAAAPIESRRFGRLVLAAGRPGACPGAARLISALPALPDGVELAVAGDGAAVRALQAHAADLAVERRVRFLGRLDDPARHRWLRTADVVASMASDASVATALLEARAAGVPVVASDIAVHREADDLLGAGGLHLVSPQASPLALADVLAAVAAAPAPEAGDGLPAWAAVADLTVAQYERCMPARAGTAAATATAPAAELPGSAPWRVA